MKKNIKIHGMHCVSCEIVLEKELKKLKGVSLLMLSHKNGIMEIEYKNEKNYEKVVQIIEKNGFSVEKNSLDTKKKIIQNSIAIGIVLLLLCISYFFNLYQYIPDTSTLSYSGALLVGFIASLSTCLAITGGLIIGFSKYIDATHTRIGHIKVQLGFQIGRILGFFLLGGILGMTGQVLNISFSFTGIFTFIIGLLLFYMGLNILGIVPSVSRFGVHMPKSFASKIEKLGKPKYAPIVGVLTFFLPCGFTQTMQLLAISSGSFWAGGLVMLFFALGTFPVLFSVGVGSSLMKERKFPMVQKIITGLLLFFGIITVVNSYNLLSFYLPSNTRVETTTASSNTNTDVEIVRASHNGWSTVPEEIMLEKGKNYKVIITPEQNGYGCMATQFIPKLKSKVSYVRAGEDIVYEINDAKPGRYDIVCASMGMYQGTIVVQ